VNEGAFIEYRGTTSLYGWREGKRRSRLENMRMGYLASKYAKDVQALLAWNGELGMRLQNPFIAMTAFR
jgi:hypothetical protein